MQICHRMFKWNVSNFSNEVIKFKKNDIIIMPIINFVASANIANLLGCKIYFADVHEKTGQMTPETLKIVLKITN